MTPTAELFLLDHDKRRNGHETCETGLCAVEQATIADSTDPTTGLQPAVDSWRSWPYRHAQPVKPADYTSPYRSGRARNLAAARRADVRPLAESEDRS